MVVSWLLQFFLVDLMMMVVVMMMVMVRITTMTMFLICTGWCWCWCCLQKDNKNMIFPMQEALGFVYTWNLPGFHSWPTYVMFPTKTDIRTSEWPGPEKKLLEIPSSILSWLVQVTSRNISYQPMGYVWYWWGSWILKSEVMYTNVYVYGIRSITIAS